MPELRPEWNVSFAEGMSDAAASTGLGQSQASLLLNHWIGPSGNAEVRGGSRRTHAAALNSGTQCWGATTYRTAAGVLQEVAFFGDRMYYSTDQGVTWTNPAGATGLRTDHWSFATARVGTADVLFMANGSTSLYSWDGTTWATSAAPAAGCYGATLHNDRLWVTDGRFLYGSRIRSYASWAAPFGVALNVVTHDGDGRVLSLYSLGPWLLVSTQNSMGYIAGEGGSDLIAQLGPRGVSRDVGFIAPRSLVGLGGNAVMGLTRRGFALYRSGAAPVVVSGDVESFMASINFADIDASPGVPCAYYYAARQTYVCFLPSTGATNEVCFVARLSEDGRRVAVSLHDVPPEGGLLVGTDADGYLTVGAGGFKVRTQGGYLSLASGSTPGRFVGLDADGYLLLSTNNAVPAAVYVADRAGVAGMPVAGGYDGFVRNLDTGAMDDALTNGTGGTPYVDRLHTRPMIFGSLSRRKRGRIVRLRAVASTGTTARVRLIADGSEGPAHTVSIPAAAAEQAREGRCKVSKRGDSLIVEVASAGAGTEIAAVGLHADILRERP